MTKVAKALLSWVYEKEPHIVLVSFVIHQFRHVEF